jgi:hypothetical protein
MVGGPVFSWRSWPYFRLALTDTHASISISSLRPYPATPLNILPASQSASRKLNDDTTAELLARSLTMSVQEPWTSRSPISFDGCLRRNRAGSKAPHGVSHRSDPGPSRHSRRTGQVTEGWSLFRVRQSMRCVIQLRCWFSGLECQPSSSYEGTAMHRSGAGRP